MATTVEQTIYKLEIDDSGYIRGIESLSASTKKFAENQAAANDRLRANEAALKTSTDVVEKSRKGLDNYTGTNEKYRKQLEKTFKDAQADQQKLVALVEDSRKKYDQATQAAQEFAETSARATALQGQAGGRIPTPTPATPPIAPEFQRLGDIADTLPAITELPEVLRESRAEFELLRAAVVEAEAALETLDPGTQEFEEYNQAIQLAKKVLAEFDSITKETGGSTLSLRTQIRQGREELTRLEDAGLSASQQFQELEQRVASLTDQYSDQQERIKILASDTKVLDFGKGAITAATSAFQAYTSISILAGDESEELQKKTMQLFAAMQLLQSIEQLSNLTRREGVLSTLALTGAQTAYTAVVGATTGALRAFRIALAATGVGVLIAGVAFLVNRLNALAEATRQAGEAQRQLNEVNQEAIKSSTADISRLKLIRDRLTDLNVPQKERIRLAKEYNKTAEEGNKIDLKQIDNISLVNRAIDSQIKKIGERARAKAAENVITLKQEQVFLAEEAARNRLITSGRVIIPDDRDRDNFFVQQQINKLIEQERDVVQARRELERALRTLSPLIKPGDLVSPDFGKDTKETKEVENVFAQKLRELQARLAEVTAESFESEGTIRKQFAASLENEISALNKLVKDKKLTQGQAAILIDLTTRINDVELNDALADFNKKVTDARKKLNDEIRDLQNKNTEDTLNLLQDEFDRRAALIEFNEQQELENSRIATDERLAALDLDRALIGEQAYQDAKARIISAGELAALNITRRFAVQRQDLAADLFIKSLDSLNNIFAEQLLQLDEITAGKLQDEKRLFDTGVINYDDYQKRITKILADQKAARDKLRLAELNTELAAINKRLETTTDAEEKARLQERQRSVRGQIADINSEQVQDPNTEQVETVQDYVEAIGQLTDSIIAFWQNANQAEAEALDRSIALQEQRVNAAQRIAERGNAQYLKAEEDRLKELQLARENAARRQLAIDAALQASQLLVGITGAISKIATPGIGVAETIAAVATIVATLAAGYGIVKSLQGNQPRLKEGTTYVKRTKEPAGVDTIPAWLNEGEAVIPTHKNKAYHPTIKAVYEGTVPPEQLNKFVTTYTKVKAVPQVNYEKIKESAEVKISQDGRTAAAISEQNKLIMENNDLQRATLRAMKNMSVSATIDKDGVAIMVNEFMNQMMIDKFT